MEATHFKNKEEVLVWFSQLPENVSVFFGNLNWTLFHQPLSEDTEKIDQMRVKFQQQFDVDLAQKIASKDTEIGKLENDKEGLLKTIEENAAEIIRLNAKVEKVDQEKRETIEKIREKCEQQSEKDLAQKTTSKDLEIGSLKKDKEELLKTIVEKAGEIKRLNAKVDNYEQDTRQKIDDAVQKEKANAKTQLQNEIGSKVLEITTKEQEVNRLNQQLGVEIGKATTMKKEIKSLQTQLGSKISSVEDTINKHFGENRLSAEKGQLGEDWVYQMLNNDPTMNVYNVAKGAGHKGDLIVAFKGSNIQTMIDVKNYKVNATIPLVERTKFFNDLETNAGFHCGILLSLHGGFNQDMEEFKVYKTDKARKPYCYLGNLATRMNPETVLKILLYVLQKYAESDNATGLHEKKVANMVNANITAWLKQKEDTSKSVKETRKLLKILENLESQSIASFDKLKREWEDIEGNKDDAGQQPTN
jgi:hypothetical protein